MAKRKKLTGFIVDEMLKDIPTSTVKVRCVEYFPNVIGFGSIHEGKEYEIAKDKIRTYLISGHCVLLGPGTKSEPSEAEKVRHWVELLDEEVAEMKRRQQEK